MSVMDNLPDGFAENLIFGSLIAFIAVALYRILMRLHKAPKEISRIDFEELLLDAKTGKTSTPQCVLWGSFVVTSFAFLYAVFKGEATAALLLAFGGLWVSPTLVKTYKGDPDDPLPPPAGPTTTVVAAGDVKVNP